MNKKSPEASLDKLKRALIGVAMMGVENKDRFITALYSLGVLEESPIILVRVPIFQNAL